MAGRLPEPNRSPACDEPVDFSLDLTTDLLGNRLHEREVFGVLWSICIQRNGFEEPNLEFCRQIHRTGGQPGPWEGVVDREVDQPREALERPYVSEDRHGL